MFIILEGSDQSHLRFAFFFKSFLVKHKWSNNHKVIISILKVMLPTAGRLQAGRVLPEGLEPL